MKKFTFIFLILIITMSYTLADSDDVKSDIIFLPKKNVEAEKDLIEGEHEVIYEKKDEIQTDINPYTKKALKGIIQKDYNRTSLKGLFNEQLTFKNNKSPIEATTFHIHTINTLEENISDSDNDFKARMNLINFGINGNFRNKKESYSLLFDLSPQIFEDFSHNVLLDAYIETKRIPHHSIIFGSSRTKIGYESTLSSKVMPVILRSQSIRNFGNIRKTGLKISGDFKYIDYEIGGYSSDTRYKEFFPGVETTMWLDIKPLAKFNDKYGKLYVGGGINSGNKNSQDFLVISSALRYYYKKLWLQAEYQNADGYNGGYGYNNNKAFGYNFTLGYNLTKKLELILRYDEFDKNKEIKNNNSTEYTAGINWYVLGQCAKVILNYVYCQNKAKDDSHRIILGTQLIL